VNLYAFVGNRLVNAVDVLGLFQRYEIHAPWTNSPFGSRVTYSCRCGWIDWGHADGTAARVLIDAVRGPVSQNHRGTGMDSTLLSRDGQGFQVRYSQQSRIGSEDASYYVQFGLRGNDSLEAALGIFKDFSWRFEVSQGQGFGGFLANAIRRRSSFAVDDLPSNLIGFYRVAVPELADAARIGELCDALLPSQSLQAYRELYGEAPAATERWMSFKGLRHENVSCCRGRDRSWPGEFETIRAARRGTTWRYWDPGRDEQPFDWNPFF